MPSLKQMWQAGASYEELHRVDAPHPRCECSYCDMCRCFDDWDAWAYRQGVLAAPAVVGKLTEIARGF